ncbi:hypothetical protein ACGFZR_13580 [Streptomyces sp. NPDC048241]|uniref:hypothetical protein n=1 Tax=Streptomyces sp. NPDC048241 TaxID=3365521 RepID=UPI0037121404
MTSDVGIDRTCSGAHRPELPTRALTRESDRARQLLAAGEWHPTTEDTGAAAKVLDRLAAPLPTRGTGNGRARAVDRDRRLQRVWRTSVHHLDAGAVTPPCAALLAAVARAFLPWSAAPNPPAAAAAPRYPTPHGTADGSPPPPTEAGEALLADLIPLFASLAAPSPPGDVPRTPAAVPWNVRHTGRFRHYERPARDVWTAETVRCAQCAQADGPWTVACDWHQVTLECPCGLVTDRHGLRFSEVFLVLPDR